MTKTKKDKQALAIHREAGLAAQAIKLMEAEASKILDAASGNSTQSFDLVLANGGLRAQITTDTAVFQISGRDVSVTMR